MKVVGIGLNKTGTTTLGVCLRQWGFRHASWNRQAFDLWMHSRHRELLDWVADYDSFEDYPWLLLYAEIDQRFPGSKFILTRRESAERWYKSICAHSKWTGPHDVNRLVYGHALPYGHEADHVDFYQRYIDTVRAYFDTRPGDLLEVCWEEGDGWNELAGFLGREAPNQPFPHANKTPTPTDRALHLARRAAGKARSIGQSVLSRLSGQAG